MKDKYPVKDSQPVMKKGPEAGYPVPSAGEPLAIDDMGSMPGRTTTYHVLSPVGDIIEKKIKV
jgi:hypothetical protein